MMVAPTVITGAKVIGRLPDRLPDQGEWHLMVASGFECVVAIDQSCQFMPIMVCDDRVVPLIGVPRDEYLQFLLDPTMRGRKH